MKRFVMMAMRVIVCMCLLVMVSTPLHAANKEFTKDYNFTAYNMGRGVIHFKLLVFADGKKKNHWAGGDAASTSASCVYFYDKTTKTNTPLIYYNGDNNKNKYDKEHKGYVWMRVAKDMGRIVVTNLYSGEKGEPTECQNNEMFILKRENGGLRHVFIEFDWYMPERFATQYHNVWAYINDTRTDKHWNRYYELVDYEGAEALRDPELYTPVFYPTQGTNASGRSFVAVPYSTIYTPKSYTTNLNKNVKIQLEEQAGMLMVEAQDTARNYFLNMDVSTNDGGAITTLKSNEVLIPAYHGIHDFKVEEHIDTMSARTSYDLKANQRIPVNRGHKRLTWTIHHAQVNDVLEMDMFEVQRAYKSDFSDAQTIGSVNYDLFTFENSDSGDENEDSADDDREDRVYEYIDSTEYAIYNHLDPSQPVYYRVRRATAATWGWNHAYAGSGSCASSAFQIGLASPTLLREGDFEKRYKDNHEVVIDIMTPEMSATATSGVVQAMWDPRATIRVQREDSNTPGAEFLVMADSLRLVHTRTLNGQQLYRWQYRFVDAMPTPCVTYKYKVSVDTTRIQTHVFDDKTDLTGIYAPQYARANDGMFESRFDVIPSIGHIEATQGEYKSQTVIKWEPSATGIEYYDVLRDGEVIAKDLTETIFCDKTGVGGKVYEYQVRGKLYCVEPQETLSEICTGYRSPYGLIKGKVLNINGTALAGVQITVERDGADTRNFPEAIKQESVKDKYVVVTDENGSFFIDDIAYSLDGSAFAVTPGSKFGLFDRPGSNVTLSTISPEYELKEFVNSEIVAFSGRVLYEGSTVPVSDVQFLMNGTPMKDSDGRYITTDNLGNFEVTVPKNYAFQLQAVKEGHTFLGDGYFYVDGKKDIVLSKTQPGMRMYDQTKVRLIGRVVGGTVENSHPLGFGLSTNNLGDNLQLVLELEGDNVSHLVHDEKDPDLKTRDEVFTHFNSDQKTDVNTTIKRITIRPDVKTGEYQVDLYPARYRVVQATADGYSSLLAAGTAQPVIDVTNAIEKQSIARHEGTVEYNADYSIVYHSPISVTYDQMQYGYPLGYVGEKQYRFFDIVAKEKLLPLIRTDADNPYVLGHPLFLSGSTYMLRVQAHEDYYYNNKKDGKHSQVMMAGCPVKLYNGLDTSSSVINDSLDQTGSRLFVLMANNPNFDLTGKDALRSLSVSVLVDGEYVQATPLTAYVAGTRIKGGNSINNPNLKEVTRTVTVTDVLRDPPGRNSYAYIESGTHYETSLATKMTIDLGAEIDISLGTAYKNVTGVSAGPGPFTGVVMDGKNSFILPIPLKTSMMANSDYTYSFDTKERIQTSTSPALAGRSSTVFVGTEPCVYATLNETFGVIDSETCQRVMPAINAGNIKIVAEGVGDDGKPIYLAISEETGFATGFEGYFAYSEHYILNTLLPQLLRERNSLLLIGTHDEVQAIADKTQKRQYRSKVAETDEDFGVEYEVIDPKNGPAPGDVDRVEGLNRYITDWIEVITREETTLITTKYNKAGLLNTYNIAGASVDYNETTNARLGYQDKDNKSTFTSKVGSGSISIFRSAAGYLIKEGANQIFAKSAEAFQKVVDKNKETGSNNPTGTEGSTPGFTWRVDVKPIFDFKETETNHLTNGISRTVGFHIDDDPNNHMAVEVYRVVNETNGFGMDAADVFDLAADYDHSKVYDNSKKYADFVYYVNAGATRAPHRDATVTGFYMPGTKIDEGTLNMEIPRLKVNTNEISNVPEGESAIFDLQISLESESEENVSFGRNYILFLDDNSNKMGAGLFIDGQPIADGRLFRLVPGKSVFHKMLEVRQGVGYDFEDIKLKLVSEDDRLCSDEVTLSVHFIPSSSPVKLALVSDKWLLNTLSPKDETGYYLPIEITGFDVNYRNFDHIEFQYKLTSQSNDAWVNLCSYYADEELYQKATGTKGRITNGIISNIHFYGERDPIEQQYDLRAVSFSRLGSGYVSRSSEVLSGRKDTRCPQVFGNVTPKDGILGPGDYISIPFSEDIAANYLDEDNNFQIYGYTNGSGITNSTSVLFDGGEGSVAVSQSVRSLGQGGFTIDMMVKPEVSSENYTYFCMTDTVHDYVLNFGQTEGRLSLYMRGNGWDRELMSDSLPSTMGWTRVAVTYDDQTAAVNFFVGSENVTRKSQSSAFNGFNITSNLMFGGGDSEAMPMKGNMLEARVWNRALDHLEIANTNQRTLSGYERGLLAYYPMNEGNGQYLYDQAHGANLVMNGTSWSLPAGRSILFGETNIAGVKLNEQEFERTELSDYTLSLWFKADVTQSQDTVAIFSAGRGTAKDLNGRGGLFLGLEGGHFVLRQNDFSIVTEGNYQDNKWHNVAVSVAHDVNSATLYMDGEVLRQFNADKMTGISSQNMYLGACHWYTRTPGGEAKAEDTFPYRGYIDDVILYNSAMAPARYKLDYGRTPLLDDITLLCYLNFQRSELSPNGRLETVFSPYNAKVYKDMEGNKINKDVALLTASVDSLAAMSSNVTAYIRDAAEPTKLKFSWVGKDNELVINVNMSDYEVNHQNIFVTVCDVEDNAGNLLASPVSWTVYVDKNPLKWRDSYAIANITAGEKYTLESHIYNRTGKTLNYRIDDLPDWVTCIGQESYMVPGEDAPIYFKVSEDLEPGYYTALLQLTDENGLTDPILLVVNVKANEPDIEVDSRLTQSMNVIAQVMVPSRSNAKEYVVDLNGEDIVYAYIGDLCVGKQHIGNYTGTTANLMMNVHGDETLRGKLVRFCIWQAKTGQTSFLEADVNQIKFTDNAVVGTTMTPVVMRTTDTIVQIVNMNKGWNWVSFYTNADQLSNSFVQTSTFTPNDQVKTYYTQKAFATYMADGQWQGDLEKLDYHQMYMFYVQNPGPVYVMGGRLTTEESRTVTLKQGWNELPYLLEYDEDVNTALSDYFGYAAEGDMVKGFNEFAMFDAHSNKWIGSLSKMRTGNGYMLLRNAPGECSVVYRPQDKGLTNDQGGSIEPGAASSRAALSPTNMAVLAVAEGNNITVEPGDRLSAYTTEGFAGDAVADSEGRFFLMTHAEDGQNLSFALERNGMVVASVDGALTFRSNGTKGSLASPYAINFTPEDEATPLYDLSGRRTNAKTKGFYVGKNKKVLK